MNRGFTILELLVGAVVLAVLSAAIGTILLHGQWSLQTQTDLTRSIEQSRVALDLIVRYLRQAGNDPFATLEEGGIPAVTILGPGAVQISSDVTGSRASTSGDARESTGDPDGSLDSIHEQVLFRFEESNHRLLMDIGYGPEVLVENLDLFELRYFDALGNETNDSNQVARVNIRMVPVMESASLQTGDIYGTTISSDVFLQASSYNIFGGDRYSNGMYNGLGSGGDGPVDDPSGGDSSDDHSGDDYSGDDQSSDSQSDGDSQSGDDQSSDSQSDGDSQSGDDQSGDSQSGDDQSGDSQSDGDSQSGDDQGSDSQSGGDSQSGDDQSGDSQSDDDSQSGDQSGGEGESGGNGDQGSQDDNSSDSRSDDSSDGQSDDSQSDDDQAGEFADL